MRILVTGGAGFIGSNYIYYHLKHCPQDHLTVLDSFTYAGHLSSLKPILNSIALIKGDICNPKTVDKAMTDIDVVVHFAAESHVDRSILGPATFVKTNVLGTQVLLDSAKQHQVKHFHHVSTDEVFGSLSLNSNSKFSESAPYTPHSPYSATKAASDHLVRAYHDTFGLPITITNCSNNYGPYQDPEKLLPRFITNLIDNQHVKVYGDGKYIRDWLYVADHCSAIDLVINKGKVGDTYCVGGLTEDISNLDLTKKILKIMGKGVDMIDFVTDRPGHDRRYAIDWTKLKKLGWKPKYSLDEYLKKTIDWYIDNQSWWRPLKKRAESIYK